MEEIQRQSGQQFDPRVVEAFLQVVTHSPPPLSPANLYQRIP
jgi:HD-GYP domain-containing protein (c-di-GMP phosphodiesterase class II)